MIKIDVSSKPTEVNVSEVYESYANQADIAEEFNLVCYGRILDPTKTLAHYGIRDSSVVYAFKKNEIKLPSTMKEDASQATGVDLSDLSFSLWRSAMDEPEFPEFIENLRKNRDIRDPLISVTPGLKDDPLAIAIIQDVDLLNVCLPSDPKVLQTIMNRFPSVMTAAGCLADQFFEQMEASGRTANRDGTRPSPADGVLTGDPSDPSTFFNVLLGRSRNNPRNTGPGLLPGAPQGRPVAPNTTSTSTTGADDLNSFLNRLRSAPRNTGPGGLSGASNASSAQQGRAAAPLPNMPPMSTEITPQMLQNAIQAYNLPNLFNPASLRYPSASSLPQFPSAPSMTQSSASSTISSTATASTPASAPAPAQAPAPAAPRPSRDWSAELQQMREMGLVNESLCIDALEATNGNVALAIDLILSWN